MVEGMYNQGVRESTNSRNKSLLNVQYVYGIVQRFIFWYSQSGAHIALLVKRTARSIP